MEKNIYNKLHKVQQEIGTISKDSKNPFYKSKYFDINSLIKQVTPILDKHKLILLQPIKDGHQYSIIIDLDGGSPSLRSLILGNPSTLYWSNLLLIFGS